MAPLIRAAAAFASLLGVPAHAGVVERWRPFVAEASSRFGLPASWIERVLAAESGGRTRLGGLPIRSRKGAIGLMQLMPATWAEMRARLELGDNPDDPRDNILAGAFYLRLMYDRFGYPGLFAAYNAGPARYAAYLAGRALLPAETTAYLGIVGGNPPAPVPPQSRPAASLFAVRTRMRFGVQRAGDLAPVDTLFVIRRISR